MTALGVGLVVALFGGIGFFLWRKARPTAVPGAARDALYRVWTTTWGLDPVTLPVLIAVRGADLNCHNGRGWKAVSLGKCVAGTHSGAFITVAFPDGVPLHETALVHEAAHCRLDMELRREVADEEAHANFDFNAWIVQGNEALAGL